MPYVMENRSDAYVSVSGFGDLGASPESENAVKAAVKKLQRIIGVDDDGKYGGGTHAKFLAWARSKLPAAIQSTLTSASLSPVNPLAMGNLAKEGMTASEIAYANIGWACYANPSKCPLGAPVRPTPTGTTVSTAVPSAWMTGEGAGPVEEEIGFFDKYWWLIAIGALGVGGFVFWKMRRKTTEETIVVPGA